ncbi:MAG: hypothetical protein COU71_01275 [Parcubacteria group bacterium CG10_big_fil_rev_8_21_14_0_10_38_31]|nr:MAG: hypothetical protein COU71_01275 [Parcubacteria group bacterium CG10_big_fil_rev_8_21_14_0_10_38_31]
MSEEGDNIEKLKMKLYRKGASFQGRFKRSNLGSGINPKDESDKSEWDTSLNMTKKKKIISKMMRFVLLFAGIFFSVSLLATAYLWDKGFNFVSSGDIEIVFEGPDSVSGGELNNWRVIVTNNNNAPLKFADLILEYPSGTRDIKNENKSLTKRYPLGQIAPGGNAVEILDLIFFGASGSEKVINATLEYRLTDSNAIFTKEEKKIVKLFESPIDITVKLPSEVNARQEMSLEVEYVSNSEGVIDDLVLRMEYPPGFQFKDSNPNPSSAKNDIWNIGTLDPGKKRVLKINGIVDGGDLDEKGFRAQVGVMNNNEFEVYGEATETVVLKKMLLDLAIFINGNDDKENIASLNDIMRVDIFWRNNLPVRIENGNIEVKVTGKAANLQSISPVKGFYRTSDNALVWNASSVPEFRFIEPGQEGKVSFTFSILGSLVQNSMNDKNFVVSLEASIFGRKATGGFGDTEAKSMTKKDIKIASNLQFASKALYYDGVFTNIGPLPPKAGEKTTYTIVWSLSNSTNDVENVIVRAFLPSYVEWEGSLSPQDTLVSYDKNTGEVVWKVGLISAGTGILNPAREVSFQIGLLPSLSQVGSAPNLVSEVVIEGKDSFVGTDIRKVKGALSTRLDNDTKFKLTQEKVVQ